MTRIYRYILETDSGMAPCPQNGMMTLGTCKPGIRKMAQIGDWIAGFMPGSDNRGELAWVGRVASKLSHDDYRRTYPLRRDAIYALDAAGIYRSYLPRYHCDPTQQARDHDNPVLVFDARESWYFGNAPHSLPDALMHLAAQGRGYRVNFRRDGDLALWEAWLSQRASGVHGEPRDSMELCQGCIHCGKGPNPDPDCGGARSVPARARKSSC